MPSRAVVWFRRDLRVADHPALLAALDAADQVVPLFVVDRALLGGPTSGPNRHAFLHGALQSLARDLEALGGRLLVREGDPVETVPALARAAADAVYCSREHTPYARRRDTAVERALRADGRPLHALPGIYLTDFDELRKTDGTPFRIYTPFSRAAKAASWDDPLPAPARVVAPDDLGPAGPWPPGLWTARSPEPGNGLRSPTGGPGTGPGGSGAALGGFGLEGAVKLTPPDPVVALERLRWFVERRVDGYARARNFLAADGTSRLSPYLRFGLVSPRQVAAAAGSGGRAWQWVAGTGTDAAPYYRIFNPVTQAEKFDPGGDYIRRWVPELAKLDPPAIFAPWRASPADLRAAGVRLGAEYPHPMVDHLTARDRALARFQEAGPRRS
jgi:deoxyribodipyrimidine photo-lyase